MFFTQGLDLLACVDTDESRLKPYLHLGTKLHFEFYEEAKAGASGEPSSTTARGSAPGGLRVIDLEALDKYPEDEQEIFRQLISRYSVPIQQR